MKVSLYYKDPDAVSNALEDLGIECTDTEADDAPDGWNTLWKECGFDEDLYITYDTDTKDLHIEGLGHFIPKP